MSAAMFIEAMIWLGCATLALGVYKVAKCLALWVSGNYIVMTRVGKTSAKGFTIREARGDLEHQLAQMTRLNEMLQDEIRLLKLESEDCQGSDRTFNVAKSAIYVTSCGDRFHTNPACGSIKNHGYKELQPCAFCSKRDAKKST
jgi:hypothetical protein